jgi:hypothetical protein
METKTSCDYIYEKKRKTKQSELFLFKKSESSALCVTVNRSFFKAEHPELSNFRPF